MGYADTALARWLLSELNRRNLTAREASLNAGLSHGAISNYLNGNRPAARSCTKLAESFGVPEEWVLQLAGHIRPRPQQELFQKQLGEITGDWTEPERQTLVELALALDRQRKGT